jgi:flagellar biosynthesis protein FlhF
MQVKKFEAPTIQEALDTIKRELGPEAIILQTKQYKKGFGLMSKGSVEVTAAISDRSLQKKQHFEKRLPEPARQSIQNLPADRQADVYDRHADKLAATTRENVQLSSKKLGSGATSGKAITQTRYADIDADEVSTRQPMTQSSPQSQAQAQGQVQRRALMQQQAQAQGGARAPSMIEHEVTHLKRMVEELRASQEETIARASEVAGVRGTLNQSTLQSVFEELVVGGMDKRFALNLVRKVGFELGPERATSPDLVLEQLATEIMGSIEVAAPVFGVRPNEEAARGPMIVALVGPTGVGKTTTVAKIASVALLKHGLKVGLINLDNYKIAAFDQLGTYAKILNVPFRSVSDTQELNVAIQDFQSLDLILIDTTGRSQRDPGSLKEMQRLMAHLLPQGLATYLVLSATTRDNELYDMASRFGVFRPQGLVFSKLDEATTYGAIYNLSQKAKLPLVYFTTGQRVPEDFEEATRERLASLLLDI